MASPVGSFDCKTISGTSTTWFPCSNTSTKETSTSTSTTTSPASTTATPTQSTTTTTTTPTSNTSDDSNGPPTSSTALTGTSTAFPNSDSGPTSSVPTSSPTISPIHQHEGLSTGATAGIAIGCAAVGLIIGLLAALLLFRRRKGKGVTDMSHAAILVDSKEPPSAENIDSIGFGAGIQLGQFLLDGAPDQEIVSELQSLGELIRQHVEDHYSLQPVDASVRSLSQSLQGLGLGSQGVGLDSEAIATLCTNSYSRHLGLRYVISTVVFASIDFHARSGISMLPGPVAGLLQSVPPAEYGGSNPRGT